MNRGPCEAMGLILVTNKTSEFTHVRDLRLENWAVAT